ncbi:MAG: FcoT family thioesterase [Bacteroidota bacterium]
MEAQKALSAEKYILSEIDEAFLQKVLTPYRQHCHYLKKAVFQQEEEQGVQGLIIKGEFAIGDSCYIDDTGHFNAVEYNICYNQIAYLHLGYCIKNNLIPELSVFDIDSYFEKQLSNFLIARISSSYQSQLNAKHFHGTFGISAIKRTAKCTFINTYCYFNDDKTGTSKGEVTLAVLHP